MTNRICSSCGIEKSEIEFRKEIYKKQCKQCLSAKSKEYNQNNKEARKEYNKSYQRGDKRKIYLTSYYELNGDKLRATQKEYQNKKYYSDPAYRLRKIISGSVSKSLKSRKILKNKKSYLKYLPYSTKELKQHLENQFEPWMTWDNQGTYNHKTWKDEDKSTWVWNIDHIIPHSIFQYTSMEDQSFKECWALSNLRPYSAKQNIVDGATKIRHNKEIAET
jgi:hypothetical protein